MNKTTKGAVAVGAAAVILLGGAGSLAFWNDSVAVPGGAVNSGKLTLDPVAPGQWTLNGTTVANPQAVVLVPGDELAYAGTFVIGAAGDNLEATVDVSGGAAAGDLTNYVDTTVAYAFTGEPGTPVPAAITEENDGDEIDVAVTIDFPFDENNGVADNDSQTKTLNLSEIAIVLTQTDATP